jgi:hypothetical protein
LLILVLQLFLNGKVCNFFALNINLYTNRLLNVTDFGSLTSLEKWQS